jgi:hypothetical protein
VKSDFALGKIQLGFSCQKKLQIAKRLLSARPPNAPPVASRRLPQIGSQQNFERLLTSLSPFTFHLSPFTFHFSPFPSAVPSAAKCITFSSVASARATSPVSRP